MFEFHSIADECNEVKLFISYKNSEVVLLCHYPLNIITVSFLNLEAFNLNILSSSFVAFFFGSREKSIPTFLFPVLHIGVFVFSSTYQSVIFVPVL